MSPGPSWVLTPWVDGRGPSEPLPFICSHADCDAPWKCFVRDRGVVRVGVSTELATSHRYCGCVEWMACPEVGNSLESRATKGQA